MAALYSPVPATRRAFLAGFGAAGALALEPVRAAGASDVDVVVVGAGAAGIGAGIALKAAYFSLSCKALGTLSAARRLLCEYFCLAIVYDICIIQIQIAWGISQCEIRSEDRGFSCSSYLEHYRRQRQVNPVWYRMAAARQIRL
jgi:hypothetical protein